jgi:hypothetical protein
MGNKFKRAVPSKSQQAGKPKWLLLATLAVVALAVVSIAIWLVQGQQATADYVPEVVGQPGASIDQTAFDYGDVKLGSTVETVFRVKNVGEKDLVIQGEPRVEVLEGC